MRSGSAIDAHDAMLDLTLKVHATHSELEVANQALRAVNLKLFRTLDADTRLTYSPSCDTRCAWPDTGPPADYNTGCPAGNRRESALYTCVLCRNRPGDHYRSRARGGRHERTKSPSLNSEPTGWPAPRMARTGGNHPLRESDGGSPLGERRGAAGEQVGLDFRRTVWKRTPRCRCVRDQVRPQGKSLT